MTKNKKPYIINTVATLICLILLSLVHLFIYKGLGSSFPFIMLTTWLTTNAIRLFSKKSLQEKHLFTFGLFVIIISIVTYIFSLPPISYPRAKDIATDYGLVDLKEPPFDVVLADRLPKNKRIVESYMFVGKLEDKDVYLMVSPMDGSIQVEGIGDSYIDRAIKLIEERNK